MVLNIPAYNAIVSAAPRADAICETYQNGLKVSLRACSKIEDNFSRVIIDLVDPAAEVLSKTRRGL